MVLCRRLRRRMLLLGNRKTFSVCTVIFCIVFIFNGYVLTSKKSCPGLSCISPPSPSQTVVQMNTATLFLVHTSSCTIKDESPQPPSKLVKIVRQVCQPAAFTVSKNILRLSKNKAGKIRRTNCCFREITRREEDKEKFSRNADWLIKTSKTCHPIPINGLPLNSSSFIQVECDEMEEDEGKGQPKKNTMKKKSKYMDYVATVLPPETQSKETAQKATFWKEIIMDKNKKEEDDVIMSKQEEEKWRKTNPSMPPSILILGINGISRFHSLTALPKTRDFLVKNDFIEMKGFTKIGLNTFANMMAVLTGLVPNHWCYEQAKKVPLDDCPFIWKNFSEKNYITGLIEDSPGLGMFNYDKIGFVHQPVDYSIRTAFVALQRNVKVARNLALNGQCMGGRTLFDNLFKYIRDFLHQVGDKCPYFLVTWFKTLKSHYYDSIMNEDANFTHLLSDFITNNLGHNGNNNTVIIVLSGHGQELMGSLAGSYTSFYEEALPLNFIRIPPSLKNTMAPPSRHWYKNLQSNSHLLTTPYDVHKTLTDILNLFNDDKHQNPPPSIKNFAPTLGYSLFEKIPENRSCSSSIPSKYCRCDTTPLLFNRSKLAEELGKAVTITINLKLKPVLGHRLCVPLSFNRLAYGHRIKDGHFRTFVDYLVGIEVTPSLAIFEAVVRDLGDGDENKKLVIGDEVKRVSPGKNESFCVADHHQSRFVKPYCFCYEVHLLQRIAQSKSYMKWSSRN